MAAGRLPYPGTEYGPCVEDCNHTDCALTHRQAEQRCPICGNPIGYGTRFYRDPESGDPTQLVHADCLEDGYTDAPETTVKHPEVEVQLVGEDGNAYAIMGRVASALRRAGLGSEVATYREEATSGDYDNLLRVTMEWVTVK